MDPIPSQTTFSPRWYERGPNRGPGILSSPNLCQVSVETKKEGCTSNPPGSNDKERIKKLAIPRMQKGPNCRHLKDNTGIL